MFDVDALLQPRSDDAPSGEDLEYEADFIAMELAAQPGEERQVGDSIIAAEDPDFEEMIATATAVLERSHDLRAAVHLAHASLRRDGIARFAEALRYVHGCLDDYWDTCHPQLDPDDDDDPTMRVNAVLGLAGPDTMMRALRLAPLTNSRVMGRFTMRDILYIEGEIAKPPNMDVEPDRATLLAAFEDTNPEWLAALKEGVAAARTHLKGISAVFDARIGSHGPDLAPLDKALFQISKALSDYAPSGDDEGGEDDDAIPDLDGLAAEEDGAAPRPAARAAVGGGGGGTIASPADVTRTLERICDYYAKNEPSSPVPILLRRAQRLVSADFLTIMKDMAPLGLENVQLIGGLEENEEE